MVAALCIDLRIAGNGYILAVPFISAAYARAAVTARGLDLAAGDGYVAAIALVSAAYARAVFAAFGGQLAVFVLIRDGQLAAVVLFKAGMAFIALERVFAVQLDADIALAVCGDGGLILGACVDVHAGEGDVCGLILLRVDGDGMFIGASRNDGRIIGNIDL